MQHIDIIAIGRSCELICKYHHAKNLPRGQKGKEKNALPSPSVMVRHAVDLESLRRRVRRIPHHQVTPVVHVNVLPAIDILQGIPVAIAKEGDADALGIARTVRQHVPRSKPEAVQGTGDGEDLALLVGGVVDDPALGLGVVEFGGRGDGQIGAAGFVGQCGAGLLQDKVAALGEVADDLLEAVFEEEGVVHVGLVAVGDWWALGRVHGLTVG